GAVAGQACFRAARALSLRADRALECAHPTTGGAMSQIRDAIENASAFLTEHPDAARYTDSAATARLRAGLQVQVEGPNGESATTDMPSSVGGDGSAPSAGWLFRASLAACVATLVAMRAAQVGVDLDDVAVTVDSESDDRGILGLDASVPAGPLSVRVSVRAGGPAAAAMDELVAWAVDHCPAA